VGSRGLEVLIGLRRAWGTTRFCPTRVRAPAPSLCCHDRTRGLG